MSRSRPYPIGFLLLPEFSCFGLIAAIQPLFLANWRAQRTAFSWNTLSVDGAPVRASNGQQVPVEGCLPNRAPVRTLFVLASFDPKQHVGDARVRSALRRYAASGVELCGVETGSEVLAAAGLLDGIRAAVHWENLDGFRERYPRVDARAQLYHAQRGRLTCAGGTAIIDLMLGFVAREAGERLSEEVALEMLAERPRPGTHSPLRDADIADADSNDLFRSAVALMRRFIEEPLDTVELARRLNVSTRHLRRHFRQFAGTTTTRYYRVLRLSRAHNLLQQTDLSVTEVAITAGFRSLEHFSRVYRAAFGCTPSSDRRQIITAPIHRPPIRRSARVPAHPKG